MGVPEDKVISTSEVQGWLMLLCVYLRVILPSLSILGSFAYYPYLREGLGLATGLILLDFTGRIIIAIFSYSAGTALFHISEGARKRAERVLLDIIGYNAVIPFLTLVALKDGEIQHIAIAIVNAIGTVLIPLLLYVYLRTSKRVDAIYSGVEMKRTPTENSSATGDLSSVLDASLNGWQRLWVATVFISLIGFVSWVLVSAEDIDESKATCIPEALLQVKLVDIPAHREPAMLAGGTFRFEAIIPERDILEYLEIKNPSLKGKVSAYVSARRLILAEEADPDSIYSCPPGRLKPRTDAYGKYAEPMRKARFEIWSINFVRKAPIAVLGWLGLAIGLYLGGMLIDWVVDGFRRH